MSLRWRFRASFRAEMTVEERKNSWPRMNSNSDIGDEWTMLKRRGDQLCSPPARRDQIHITSISRGKKANKWWWLATSVLCCKYFRMKWKRMTRCRSRMKINNKIVTRKKRTWKTWLLVDFFSFYCIRKIYRFLLEQSSYRIVKKRNIKCHVSLRLKDDALSPGFFAPLVLEERAGDLLKIFIKHSGWFS